LKALSVKGPATAKDGEEPPQNRNGGSQLPVLASTNRGHVEALIMKKAEGNGQWQVLHLWPDDARLVPGQLPVYSGEILRHRPASLWNLFHFLGTVSRQPLEASLLDSVLSTSEGLVRLPAPDSSQRYWREAETPSR